MSDSITVIYEGGILRPLQPLALPEHARLEVRIVRRRGRASDERQQAYDALQAAGVINAQPLAEALTVVSDEELAVAAKALATAGPLSELVIAEREGR